MMAAEVINRNATGYNINSKCHEVFNADRFADQW